MRIGNLFVLIGELRFREVTVVCEFIVHQFVKMSVMEIVPIRKRIR